MNKTSADAVAFGMRSKLPLVVISVLTVTLAIGSLAAVADPVEEGSSTTAPALGLSKPATAAPAGVVGSGSPTNATPVVSVTGGPSSSALPGATGGPSSSSLPGATGGQPAAAAEPGATGGPAAAALPGATSGPPTTAYDLGKAALDGSDYVTAVAQFKAVIAADPKNADAHNLLAFSSRKNGDLKTAFTEYKVALKLNPKHRGAHEYLGEYYVQVGKLTLAKAELAKLKTICGVGCEQYLDLAATIASVKKK